jgi:hypothetical protein
MRPGKIFQLIENTDFFANDFVHDNPKMVQKGEVIFVLSVVPDEKLAKWHDLHYAWLVLWNEQVGLIDINNLPLLDITPFKEINALV